MQPSSEPTQDRAPERGPGSVVLLTAGGPLGSVAASALARRFPGIVVIVEDGEGRAAIVRRRARLLGWPVALGQLANSIFIRLIGRRRRRRRLAEIRREFEMSEIVPAGVEIGRVPSVNSPECRSALRALGPSVVAVYGTRLIGRETLASVEAPFINYHAGINPKYRGQDPAYWALAEGDAEHAGVTIHVVDKGVDTGPILYQARVPFSPDDTIGTYQFVQMGHALPLFSKAIEDALAGRLTPVEVELPSRQWFPPPIWTYIRIGLTRRVW